MSSKIKLLFFLVAISVILSSCAGQNSTSTNHPADNPQVDAIKNIRAIMGLADLPLESKGMDTMSNSPSGNLSVAIYVDGLGRRFSVEPQSNIVVEMDARDLLMSIPASAPTVSPNQLKVTALKIAEASVPNFDSMLPDLIYSEGGKVDNYFFDWRAQGSSSQMMPPFLQIGFHKSGFIFAYINTLSFK